MFIFHLSYICQLSQYVVLSYSDCFVQIVSDIGVTTRHYIHSVYTCCFCVCSSVSWHFAQRFEATLPPSLRILLMRAVESAINPNTMQFSPAKCIVLWLRNVGPRAEMSKYQVGFSTALFGARSFCPA